MNIEYPLLDRVGGHERSFLATFFYRAVRDDGATTPVEVIRAVRRRLDQRMSHPTADPNRGDYRQVARVSSLIAAEPEEARAFAEHVLLPDEERDRHRQGEIDIARGKGALHRGMDGGSTADGQATRLSSGPRRQRDRRNHARSTRLDRQARQPAERGAR